MFSPLAAERFALGVETIYEGYLAHYGRPRLFAPADDDTALLLGDYLYAHGLVRIAELGDVDAVRGAGRADLALRAPPRRRPRGRRRGVGGHGRAPRPRRRDERRRARPRARGARPSGRVKSRPMAALVALALPLADTAEEGKHIILGMLATGFVFLAVILLGELSKYLRHRRD